MERIIRRLESCAMTRLVALGASGTELAYHCEGRHNWFDWLEVGLRDHYGRVHQTVNAGVSGETSGQMLARFERDVAVHQPHAVIVTAGGNDCNPVNEVSPAEFRRNLGEIIARTRALADCTPMLQTMYSIAPDLMADEQERARRFPEYMAVVIEAAGEEGVILIDHFTRWERLRLREPAAHRRLMRDGMHVNPLGNMVMGVDALRSFGATLGEETAQRCAEGIAVQKLLDELEADQ
jgi:lysophospholipase L1-like esterase